MSISNRSQFPKFIEQMKTYIEDVTKTGLKSWKASEGEKDDKVMAFGIMLVVDKMMPACKEIKEIKTSTGFTDPMGMLG